MTVDPAIRLERDLDAPARARAAVERRAGALDASVLSDAKLLVSELVTNSVRHGGPGPLELRVGRPAGGTLRVDVVDGGAGFVPHERDGRGGAAGGWGLEIVDAVARRWGLLERRSHVWFEVGTGR